MDTRCPYYWHESKKVGSTLLHFFIEMHIYLWEEKFFETCQWKEKTCFIKGNIVKLDSVYLSFQHWERNYYMVTSWILNSPLLDLGDAVHYMSNDRKLWENLENRYNKKNGCKLYKLQKKINDISQKRRSCGTRWSQSTSLLNAHCCEVKYHDYDNFCQYGTNFCYLIPRGK